MKQRTDFRISLRHYERLFLHRAFVVSLAIAIAAQTATTTFSQEPAAPPASNQQRVTASDAMKSQLLQFHAGSFIEVQLTSHEKLRGRLGEVIEGGFVLQTIRNNKLTELRVQFEELQSVRPLSGPQSRGANLDRALRRSQMIMGLAAAGMLVGLVAYASARR